MSEQTQTETQTETTAAAPAAPAAQPAPQFQAFAERVVAIAVQHGIQAISLSAVIPAPGSFGPSTASSVAWINGQPPAGWRTGAATMLKDVSEQSIAKLGIEPVEAPAAEPVPEARA